MLLPHVGRAGMRRNITHAFGKPECTVACLIRKRDHRSSSGEEPEGSASASKFAAGLGPNRSILTGGARWSLCCGRPRARLGGSCTAIPLHSGCRFLPRGRRRRRVDGAESEPLRSNRDGGRPCGPACSEPGRTISGELAVATFAATSSLTS